VTAIEIPYVISAMFFEGDDYEWVIEMYKQIIYQAYMPQGEID
jgi:hypothetical protein